MIRLYIPKEWTDDPKRCAKTGIPESDCRFKTKDEIAIDIVRHDRQSRIRFAWVGADAGYGKGPGFCKALDDIGQQFVVDVHSDFQVYLQDPKPYIPEKKTNRGPKHKRYTTDAKSLEVSHIVQDSDLARQPVLKLRKTSRGYLKAHCLSLKVYVWDGKSQTADQWTLVVTQCLGRIPDTKISLTNVPTGTALERLAWMQRQRYWVERAFQDAKSECGMADYQVRKWSGWHHHMALVMMAMLFMLSERIRHEDDYLLLSCADIEELLAHFLPRRDLTKKEVLNQMERRHRKRQEAIDSHSRINE